MPPKAKAGKTGKKGPVILDPLPGPEVLRPVLKYSEDDALRQKRHADDIFHPPPAEDEAIDDGSSLGDVPAELLFELEEPPSTDTLNALILAEENSEDLGSQSSATENLDEAPPSEPSADSAQTESESTNSDTEDELEVTEHDMLRSPNKDNEESRSTLQTEPRISESTEKWITKIFTHILNSGPNKKVQLHVTVSDLLETNLDFASLDSDVMARLRKVAERSSSPESAGHVSDEFESISSSDNSLTNDLKQPLPPAPPLEEETSKDKKSKKGDAKKEAAKPTEPVSSPLASKGEPSRKKYPAEYYTEKLRTTCINKPYFHPNELSATNAEQDKWVVDSAEDLLLMEQRREQVLQKHSVPISEKDFELDLLAKRAAIKSLNYETAIKHSAPIRQETSCDEGKLPRKPLVPVKANQTEDPNDEDTTSEEDVLSDTEKQRIVVNLKKYGHHGTGKLTREFTRQSSRKETAVRDPYRIKPPVHEDDLYDYYDSARSSSEWESADDDKHPKTQNAEKLRNVQKEHRQPISENYSAKFDDLYALAHDLRMPPSELRRELKAPFPEVHYEEDDDNEGWKHVQAVFEYEKTPTYYAVQIRHLEQQIRARREQWVELELDHRELSITSQSELTALEQFISFLTDQKQDESMRAEVLQSKLQQLNDQFDNMLRYNTTSINWLEGEREKLKAACHERKVDFQYKLYTLREYVEKQRRMEAKIAILRKQATCAKAQYTDKLSKLILDTAKMRNKLFRNYERKVGQVFMEYQRALMLSMNDNLQDACCEHVVSRQKAKVFSNKAIQSVKVYQQTNEKLNRIQQANALQTDLFAVSNEAGNSVKKVSARLEHLSLAKEQLVQRLDAALRMDEFCIHKEEKLKRLRHKNELCQKQIVDLKCGIAETEKIIGNESTSCQQMNACLDKLRKDLERYFRHRKEENVGVHKKDCTESFEDGFIRFLQYAQKIEELISPVSDKRGYLLTEGTLGFVPGIPLRNTRIKFRSSQ